MIILIKYIEGSCFKKEKKKALNAIEYVHIDRVHLVDTFHWNTQGLTEHSLCGNGFSLYVCTWEHPNDVHSNGC